MAALCKLYPDDPEEVLRQTEYLECIGFDQRYDVQQFTKEFIKEFNPKEDTEPRCKELIERVHDGNATLNIDTNGFKADNITKATPSPHKKFPRRKRSTDKENSSSRSGNSIVF